EPLLGRLGQSRRSFAPGRALGRPAACASATDQPPDFIADVQLSARLEARSRECVFTVSRVDPRLAVDGRRATRSTCFGPLHRGLKTSRVWDSDCRFVGAVSRQTTEF